MRAELGAAVVRRLRRAGFLARRRVVLSRQFRAERRCVRVPERRQAERRRRAETQRQADHPGRRLQSQRAGGSLGEDRAESPLRRGRLVRFRRLQVRRSDPGRRSSLRHRAMEARDRSGSGRQFQPVPGDTAAERQAVCDDRDQLHRARRRRRSDANALPTFFRPHANQMRALVATDPTWTAADANLFAALTTAVSVIDHGNGLPSPARAGSTSPSTQSRGRTAPAMSRSSPTASRSSPSRGRSATPTKASERHSTSSSARIAPVTPTSGRCTTTISGARRFAAMW